MEAHAVLKLYDKLGLGEAKEVPAKYRKLFGDERFNAAVK